MPTDDFVSTGDSGGSASGTAVASPAPDTSSESSQTGGLAPSPEGQIPGQFGPVPYDRFKEVNDGYAKLRWAESYQPAQVAQQKAFFDWLDSDPEGAFQYIESALTRSGQLKARQPATPQAGPQRPQPDVVVPETGQRFYSADAAEQLAKWTAETLMSERLAPIESSLQEQEQERNTIRAERATATLLQDADTWPHFKGHEREILNEMEADQRLSLEGAYRRVVFPKLRQLEREAIVHETKQRQVPRP